MADARANPFKMPTDEEVFILRDKEKQQKALEREKLKYQRVHEKTTWSSKIGTAMNQNLSHEKLGLDSTGGGGGGGTRGGTSSSQHMDVHLPTIDAREKDNMSEYIQKKRKMGLVRMSLATKRQEIKKLDEEAERALKRVTQQEEQLKETEDKFMAFLKHSDMEQVDAMKRAETESKAKQEKMQEIKKLSAQIAQIEADKKKNEEQMMQCLEFKEFLDLLTPQPWIKETLYNLLVEDKRNEITLRRETLFMEDAVEGATDQEEAERRALMLRAIEEEVQREAAAIARRLENEEPERIKAQLDAVDPSRVPMYFTDPDAILKRFMEIEEGNLFLIQTCQELEEEIEDIAQKYQQEQNEMVQIAQQRKGQMEAVTKRITEEAAKMAVLDERIRRAKEGGGSGPTQEQLKAGIEEKVKSIYRTISTLGDEGNVNTLSMLTNIEMRLEEMRLQIKNPQSGIDDAFVLAVMKQRDKERRRQARQILLDRQREEREKRSEIALKRSQGPVKKRVGKPVMWRSRPLDRKKKETVTTTETVNEDDEFFM